MMIDQYKILGIAPDSDESVIESAFRKLRRALAQQDFKDSQSARDQARKCLDAFENAYQVLSDSKKKEEHDKKLSEAQNESTTTNSKPRIGQICVASGIITVEQLEEAVSEQFETGIPLGEILENKQFISRQELDGLLMGQDLIDINQDVEDPLAARITALDLVSDDMLLIAHMETKAQGVSLSHALVRRGWISNQLMEILTSS